MIKVHHLDHSRSQRVLWMLEELGLPYQLVNYQRDPTTWLAPPALREIHPLGKSPVLQDDTLVLAESGPSWNTWPTATTAPASCRPNCCRPRPPSASATATGCTTPKARRCRRCC